MKKLLLLLVAFTVSFTLLAQKDKSKNKSKETKKETKKEDTKTESRDLIFGKKNKEKKKEETAIWEGTKDRDGGGPKPSRNQPAKVREAFKRDYPNASNVSWSKYRGDWTATFRNGLLTSTAVYHANGERKDTRTVIQRSQLPKVIDDIFRKRSNVEVGNIIKVEVPQGMREIFRIKTIEAGTPRFSFYDAGGQEVKYDY